MKGVDLEIQRKQELNKEFRNIQNEREVLRMSINDTLSNLQDAQESKVQITTSSSALSPSFTAALDFLQKKM